MPPASDASTPREDGDGAPERAHHAAETHAASHEPTPAEAGSRPARIRRSWREQVRPGWSWGTPAVLIACGGLFITSAISSDGTDLRPGRYQDLSAIVAAEGRQAETLTDRVTRLDAEVSDLTEGIDDEVVNEHQAQVDALQAPAGLTEVRGAGLTVTMSDSPSEVSENSQRNPNLFVVHQQDLEALLNALWAGGAEAITLQGQRIITTTGIKCQGNLVLVHGIPYPQPYEISAIGDPAALRAAIDDDHLMSIYRSQADNPEIQIGWGMQEDDALVAPQYAGLLDLQYAEPVG